MPTASRAPWARRWARAVRRPRHRKSEANLGAIHDQIRQGLLFHQLGAQIQCTSTRRQITFAQHWRVTLLLELRAQDAKIVTSPLKTIRFVPSGVAMGWVPASERSTIAKRPCANSIRQSAFIHRFAASGPRDAIAALTRSSLPRETRAGESR